MKEVSAIKSIINCNCPRCRKGIVFKHKNPYHRKFGEIEKKCSNCDLVYEMEQGFWYGAMYVSYAFGVALAIPTMLILTYITDLEIYQITGVIFLLLIATMPLLFRYSRSVWLHIFIRYDKTIETLK
ncbi:DUF983 domain-containing protein [bacterium]|nr:DUF983 domain-containing protein [bacterium]MDG1517306.1 DUF983 domain-containing protein [Flavobacteriales bacterium]